MGRSLWDTASGRDRRWTKRRDVYAPAPRYVGVVIVLLAAALVGTLAWQGIQSLLHPAPKYSAINLPSSANYVARNGAVAGSSPVAAWESDVAGALQTATAQGIAGNVTAAEVEVDRAASIVVSARMQGQKASEEFYSRSLASLDGVLKAQPDNSRLLEHVTLARIELANLRSSDQGAERDATVAKNDQAPDLKTYPGATATPILNVGPGTQAFHSVTIPGHVVIASPRAVSAQSVLDRASLGGNYLDATLMPETSEVLLPPSSRNLNDNVRVEGLTIEGASQTLDGMRWRNVTFIGMRLRYESGQILLQNVKFIRCRFGFTTDERGAKLANAIALGQTSIEIQ
jgi:hypothetical protein